MRSAAALRRAGSADVSAEITSTNGVPIIVERSMYLNTPGKAFKGGHNSAGVTTPALNWFLAEGATGPFFDTFILVANPNPTPTTVNMTFLTDQGQAIPRTYTVPANARLTPEVIGRIASHHDFHVA